MFFVADFINIEQQATWNEHCWRHKSSCCTHYYVVEAENEDAVAIDSGIRRRRDHHHRVQEGRISLAACK